MKYRETVGMASVEYEGTPQEIHALLLLIEEGSEKTSKAIKNTLKEGESKAQEEIASCSDVNIQSGSTVICVSKEVAERIKDDVENAINELKGEAPKTIPVKAWKEVSGFGMGKVSDVIMGNLEREVNRKLRTTCCVSEAINESVVEVLKNIEKALLSGQTIV